MSFTPANIPGLTLWLDAPTSALNGSGTAAANGDTVATLTDNSTSGANALQATDGSRPIYSATGCNGRPCLTFGSGKTMASSGSVTVRTVVAVAKSAYIFFDMLYSMPAGADYSVRLQPPGGMYRDGADSSGNAGSDWTVGGRMWVNNVLTNVITPGVWHVVVAEAPTAVTGTYGISGYFADRYWGGSIAAVLGFSGVLDNPTRLNVTKYLNRQYGLYAADTAFRDPLAGGLIR